MSTPRQKIGSWGESVAGDYLSRNGYTILERNYRVTHGEIDIIASKDEVLIFLEVKTRTSHAFGYPESSVTSRKQAHLIVAAEEYLMASPQLWEHWQFDIIAIEGRPGNNPVITHIENVIS
ncbi:MAG: YraN family protein [Chloroflexota bacterium]